MPKEITTIVLKESDEVDPQGRLTYKEDPAKQNPLGEIRVPRSLLDDPPPSGLRVTLTAVPKEASTKNEDPKAKGISDPGFIFRGEIGHI